MKQKAFFVMVFHCKQIKVFFLEGKSQTLNHWESVGFFNFKHGTKKK